MKIHLRASPLTEVVKRKKSTTKIGLLQQGIVASIICSAMLIALLGPFFGFWSSVGAVAVLVAGGWFTIGLGVMAKTTRGYAVEDDDPVLFVMFLFIAVMVVGIGLATLASTWALLTNG